MLGFTKKSDFGAQVDIYVNSRRNSNKDMSKISAYSKGERSTEAGWR